jgi:hypothetical protein
MLACQTVNESTTQAILAEQLVPIQRYRPVHLALRRIDDGEQSLEHRTRTVGATCC